LKLPELSVSLSTLKMGERAGALRVQGAKLFYKAR
jgi:hypothetical protein